MDLKKLRLIGIMELIFTFLLIYFNWVCFYVMEGYFVNTNLAIGFVNFGIILIFLLASSPIYFATFNPFITFFLFFFNQLSRKNAKTMIMNQLYGTVGATVLLVLQGFGRIKAPKNYVVESLAAIRNFTETRLEQRIAPDNTFLRSKFTRASAGMHMRLFVCGYFFAERQSLQGGPTEV